jgi:hypothetical protein
VDGDAGRVTMVVYEESEDIDLLAEKMKSSGKSVTRHLVDDARCEISEKGRLTAFLPGTSLRVITSIFSEQSK